MTNFEKIKNMTVEEMAEWLQTHIEECGVCVYGQQCTCPETCIYGISKWLEREVEKNDGKTV